MLVLPIKEGLTITFEISFLSIIYQGIIIESCWDHHEKLHCHSKSNFHLPKVKNLQSERELVRSLFDEFENVEVRSYPTDWASLV